LSLVVVALFASAANSDIGALGETISFGGNVHGLTGSATAMLIQGPYHMSMVAGPAGAVLNENHGSALGVDSRRVVGAVDLGPTQDIDKINILGGVPGVAGAVETVAFSFNRSGVLLGLRFDGVKDENLEYVRLELPNGDVLAMFDFEVPLRLTHQGFTVAALAVSNPLFLDDERDDIDGLNIPFLPGQTFILSYGEAPFPPGYVPRQNDLPNGIRWQGLVVVPEPGVLCLVGWVLTIASRRSPARRRPRS